LGSLLLQGLSSPPTPPAIRLRYARRLSVGNSAGRLWKRLTIMSIIIKSLHIYPIKSCAGIDLLRSPISAAGLRHDRQWMIVDAEGRFMTQRQWPRMALIRVGIETGTLRLQAPDRADCAVDIGVPVQGAAIQTAVWNDPLHVLDMGDAVAAWLSETLGTACRLVAQDPAQRRLASLERVQAWIARQGETDFPVEHAFGFADGYPLLVTSQGSLEELNRVIQTDGDEPVGMDRFRPNIVLDGLEGYDEDYVAQLQIGTVRIALVKPCARCSMPDINPLTAASGNQPGKALARMRQQADGIMFGQNGVAAAPEGAELRVGQEVEIEYAF